MTLLVSAKTVTKSHHVIKNLKSLNRDYTVSECLSRNFYPKPYLLLYRKWWRHNNYVTKFNVSKFSITKTRLHCSDIICLVTIFVVTKSVDKSRLNRILFYFSDFCRSTKTWPGTKNDGKSAATRKCCSNK